MSVRARTILTWANTRKQSSFTAPLQLYLVDALATAALAAAILVMSWRPARLSTYLVDFYCYRPPDRVPVCLCSPSRCNQNNAQCTFMRLRQVCC